MEIAIIGCSHSLNTGVDLDKTLYNINNGMVAETANNGYGAILANRFPKHNFFVDPNPGDNGTSTGAAIWLYYYLKAGGF